MCPPVQGLGRVFPGQNWRAALCSAASTACAAASCRLLWTNDGPCLHSPQYCRPLDEVVQTCQFMCFSWTRTVWPGSGLLAQLSAQAFSAVNFVKSPLCSIEPITLPLILYWMCMHHLSTTSSRPVCVRAHVRVLLFHVYSIHVYVSACVCTSPVHVTHKHRTPQGPLPAQDYSVSRLMRCDISSKRCWLVTLLQTA